MSLLCVSLWRPSYPHSLLTTLIIFIHQVSPCSSRGRRFCFSFFAYLHPNAWFCCLHKKPWLSLLVVATTFKLPWRLHYLLFDCIFSERSDMLYLSLCNLWWGKKMVYNISRGLFGFGLQRGGSLFYFISG